VTVEVVTPRVTILIKALNEEKRIAACLDAALREAATVNGDVLLVDSLSSDGTVAIARQYPIRIVQFKNISDRGCGAAVQLGYQYLTAPFVYVLDADMVLQPGFLSQALGVLLADPGLAGVGGKLLDSKVSTSADARRAAVAARMLQPVEVEELGGGGLYRVDAVRSTGYLAHRWLAAYEEAELGMRLQSRGWRLLRLPIVAVVHEGHAENDLGMLRRLWRNGRAMSGGALLRSAWGRPWFGRAARKQMYLLAVPAAHGMALLAAITAPWASVPALPAFLATWLTVIAAFAWRKRSVGTALRSLVIWHFFAIATMIGLLRAPGDPHQAIPSDELRLHSIPR